MMPPTASCSAPRRVAASVVTSSGSDKESFLDSWRRLRLVVPDEFVLPAFPNIVESQRSGHQIVLTSSRFDSKFEASIRATGAAISEIERMTLEEIFISSVQNTAEMTRGDIAA